MQKTINKKSDAIKTAFCRYAYELILRNTLGRSAKISDENTPKNTTRDHTTFRNIFPSSPAGLCYMVHVTAARAPRLVIQHPHGRSPTKTHQRLTHIKHEWTKENLLQKTSERMRSACLRDSKSQRSQLDDAGAEVR
jgi:hypothetical protein